MPVSNSFKQYILDQLSDFGEVTPKSMFGGYGLFHQGIMFGMLAGDTFKLKVDESNKEEFEVLGMKPHQDPKKKKGMPYWQVPEQVIEDKTILAEWARKSHEIAQAAKK